MPEDDLILECDDCGHPNDPGTAICVECGSDYLTPIPRDAAPYKAEKEG